MPQAVEPLDITILPNDVLLPVGCVSAVVGPTIVVQVHTLMYHCPASTWAKPCMTATPWITHACSSAKEVWWPIVMHMRGLQAPENGRAVSEGTPLCLGDRQLVGRVEDVFGPVMEPLYSLRYACGPQMPSGIAVGTQMFCIQRLTDYILPQELYVKGCAALPPAHAGSMRRAERLAVLPLCNKAKGLRDELSG